jgi:exonuclease VII small subunit
MTTPLESVQAAKDAAYDACDISAELEEAIDALNRAECALETALRAAGQEG